MTTPTNDIPSVLMTAEEAHRKIAEGVLLKPRVTIVGNFHYQEPNEQPETVIFAFDDTSKNSGETFRRKLTINGKTIIDLQWIKDPGWVVIQNLDKEKSVFFGIFEIPPKGVFPFKLRSWDGDTQLVVEGEDVKVQVFACER